MNIAQILIRPVLTEKSVHQEAANKYTFVVHQAATKVDVKIAFLALYGVHVKKVNMTQRVAKYRLGKARKPVQKRATNRRAMITLKAGEKLDVTKLKTTPKKTAVATK